MKLPLHPTPTRRRAPPRQPLLSSLPGEELGELLVRAGGTPSQARSAAARVIAYVFGQGGSRGRLVPEWSPEALGALGIGAWAHPALLALDPTSSLELSERAPAADGTERLLLAARDGELLETVIIPGPQRTTVCISSQVGCARACSFCETGKLGLVRQLDAGEIVDQVRVARALWGDKHPPIQNVVFMGMGEPFDNLEQVARATRVLTDDRGIALAKSRITVSTVGVADKLEAFFATCRAELAISLNAPDDARRSAIMPVNQRFPLDTLMSELCRTLPKGHKVLFEYILFAGENDAAEDADTVAALVRRVPSRVNVIPANPGPDARLAAPSPERVDAFVARLAQLGVVTLVRRPRGRDVGGACGQRAGSRRRELAPAVSYGSTQSPV